MRVSELIFIGGGEYWNDTICRWSSSVSEPVYLPIKGGQVERCVNCKHYSANPNLLHDERSYSCMKDHVIVYPNSCCKGFTTRG